ncbi:MAG: hypothetical protein HY912_09115 [Desulfomonile tiedjei]|uniref:Uncharacterized protein n=1 Tax=Desulfomonile tiedjei TaxID=2358 RepID=A0A9D6Z3J0_9BACT|nr:hypothetical protein [Desulfomonile tiedjei]
MDRLGRKSSKKRLSRMVQREWENMTINKHMFDVEHPSNAKSISNKQMMQIARNKIIQELTAPQSFLDET